MKKNTKKQINKFNIFFLVLFIAVLSLNKVSYSSTGGSEYVIRQLEKVISININKQSLKKILYQIQNLSGIDFIIEESKYLNEYNELTLNEENKNVSSILDKLFSNIPFTYTISSNTVIVKYLEKKSIQSKGVKLVVSGAIFDKDGKTPLVGATVVVKGASNGAIVGADGRFTLKVDKNDVLEISYIGKKTQTITTSKSKEDYVIIMKDSSINVDDVVVTGYGNFRKESFTGNHTTVRRDDLLKVSKTNVIKALQSFDPSFRIKENNQWGSDPNSLPEVYIRGESGIGVKELDKDAVSKSTLKDNPNLPTFIMDGFEINVNKLYDMDPNRIESVTILKDAAATALYGSRAANGVVIITTVTPKPGKLNVSYSLVGDIVTPDLSAYDLTNSTEKLEVERLSGAFNPSARDDIYGQLSLMEEYNRKLEAVKSGVDTYWLGVPLKSVFNHKHSLYIDGGSDNLRFGVDLQYTNQDGVMKGSKRDRYGAGFYLQYTINKLQIRNHISFLNTDSEESKYGNFTDYTRRLPYDRYVDDNGVFPRSLKKWSNKTTYRNDDLMNPVYEAKLGNFDRSSSIDFINNLSVNWNINQYLLFKTQMSITKRYTSSDRFYDPQSMKNSDMIDYSNSSSGELYTNDANALSIDVNAFISYNRQVNNHNINVQGGINMKESKNEYTSISYRGFPSGALSSPQYAQRVYDKPNVVDSKDRLFGFLAALNYSYNNIYLLDASCRIDGSSKFGSDRRFAPFWSGGAGINIHNYKFIQGIEWLNMLKIRASYGQTGKVNFPSYQAKTSYAVYTDQWYKTGYGVSLKAFGNAGLKWETTNITDIGFELSLFKNLIYLKASYYNKKTVDLVNSVTIPSSTGFTTYTENVGEVINRGYEVDLRIQLMQKGDWSFIVNANLAHNKNEITKIAGSLNEYNRRVQEYMNKYINTSAKTMATTPFTQYREGVSQNSIWGMRSMGINPADGEEVFMLADGTTTDKWIASEQMILGCRDPKIQGAFGLNLIWKNFTLYANFMYEMGGQRYNQTLVDKVENVDSYKRNVDRRILTDRWVTPGQEAKYKKLISGRDGFYQTRPTSRFVQDYNMLSLSSLTIGYDFTSAGIKELGIGTLRVESGCNDLFHISSVKHERGLSYPFARTFNLAVKISF